ncbi:hypothetical protein FJTKL_04828 [Diaporthe vaccinii]|uniref:Fork-head domain-containing protein n=1 Tax=Diaporthe vaccinii TaxID=105482 RepID=A0ABR4DT49_9PEZI
MDRKLESLSTRVFAADTTNDIPTQINYPHISKARSVNAWMRQGNPPCAKSATPAVLDNRQSLIDTASTTISSSLFDATVPVAAVANLPDKRCERVEFGSSRALPQQAHQEHQLQYALYHLKDPAQCMQSSYNYDFARTERAFCEQNELKQAVEPCVAWGSFTCSQEAYYNQLALDPRCFVSSLASETTAPNFMSSMHGIDNFPIAASGITVTIMPPISNALSITSDFNHKDVEHNVPLSQDPSINIDGEMVHNTTLYNADNGPEYTVSTEPACAESNKSYAALIHRAFMSQQDKSMKLRDLYQWFRDNTNKAKSPDKGWKSSIRHNLSMNKAFTKCDPNQPDLNNDLSLQNSGTGGSNSTRWHLIPGCQDGVESTNKFRQERKKRASRSSSGDGVICGRIHKTVEATSIRKGRHNAVQNRVTNR